MSKTDKILIGLVGLSSVLIIVFGAIFTTKSQSPALEVDSKAKVEVLGSSTHDWDRINIEGGKVEKTFQIKNIGDSTLEITNLKTSCMCTEVQVFIGDSKSPIFGMYTRSSWKGTIEPGSTADINVVFDPLFHGPGGTGPITRFVSFNTNDPSNRSVELRLSGNVVRFDN